MAVAFDHVVLGAASRRRQRVTANAISHRVQRMYLHQCSVQVTCAQLAVMGATLANGAVNPFTAERVLPRERVRDLLSVMYTCGMYDAAGQWAYEVGVPAKSGVSGGILAVVPGKLGIGVFSPGLDVYANSVRGMGVCYRSPPSSASTSSPPRMRMHSSALERRRASTERVGSLTGQEATQ